MQLNDYELLYYCYQENEASFEMLASKYERYIYYIINLFKKNYFFFSMEDSDLYNEALILLYESIFNYREEFNVKFSSYYLSCLKRRYMYLIRNLASNKNKGHALAMSLDVSPSNEDVDLYSIISNNELAISEQVNNNYLIDKTLKKLEKKLNELEKNIINQYLMGYHYEEIATQYNISKKKIDNTVQKYKKLALDKKTY
ncbi:MAG: sigma-70 family RNA polymerase sigma factor [Erysipelotrichales bacterium]